GARRGSRHTSSRAGSRSTRARHICSASKQLARSASDGYLRALDSARPVRVASMSATELGGPDERCVVAVLTSEFAGGGRLGDQEARLDGRAQEIPSARRGAWTEGAGGRA